MRRVFKILGYGVLVLTTGAIGLLTYVKTILPNVGDAPELKIQVTTEKILRGNYLANHVMVCMDCHSTRDWNFFAGPMIAGTEGKGGEVFDQSLGFPGKYTAPNITPYHLKDWTDGEIFRAVTSGVSKDGRALFSIMPYHLYGQLDRKDIEAVISYIRTLKPIENETEASSSDFPMNLIINTIPKKPAFTKVPEQTDRVDYGKYLVTAAGCTDCHTKQVKGKFTGSLFAGGFEFPFRDGSVVRSSNITPDKSTGIGTWTSEQFVTRFKMYADSSYVTQKVAQGEFQTTMPWTMYSGMSISDLDAIYKYLQSLSPVINQVEKYSPSK